MNKFPNYYFQIIQAESYLIEENFEKSLSTYISTLSTYSSKFVYDFLVPIQLSLIQNDTSSFSKMLEILEPNQKLAQNLNDFLTKKSVKWNSGWKDILDASIQNDNPIDTNCQLLIDSLFNCDQDERNSVYNSPFYSRKKRMAVWDKHSRERIIFFIDYVQKNGFPDDYQMGLHSYFFYHKNIMVIFYHYPNTFTEFKSFFSSWLYSGNLHPMHYAWIEDFFQRHKKTRILKRKAFYNYGLFASDKALRALSEKRKSLLNENRLKIGLSSIDHDLKLRSTLRSLSIFRFAFL